MLTAERLRELLHYDPETGVFAWRVAIRGTHRGARAGSVCRNGYRRICIDWRAHSEHRLVWLHVHGHWPTDQIDHVNGVRDDNRLCNLRQATHAENQQNIGVRKHNTSGHPGVCWHKKTGKWQATIQTNGVRRNLGLFTTLEEAAAARVDAKAKLHTFNPETRSTS